MNTIQPEVLVDAKRLAMALRRAARRNRNDAILSVMAKPSQAVEIAQARLRATITRKRAEVAR